MTPPAPPPTSDRRFARDVAKEVDRRRVKRKVGLWGTLLAVIAAGAMYLRCGDFGLGGLGKGGGTGEAPHPAAAPARCVLRVARSGITIDGKPRSRDEAVATCKASGGADILVTGDAREGDWTELYTALVAAGIKDINKREATAGSAVR